MQLHRFFTSNGTITKNSALFFVSSSTEVVTEMGDEVFSTRKLNLAASINHSGNPNSGYDMYVVKEGGV